MLSTIKVDVHRGKLITFDLEIAGLNYRELDAKFEINVNGIVYGFEGKITSDSVDIHIPCLSDTIHDILTYEGNHIDAKLIIYGDHFYQIPWEGKLKLETPGKVKAKISTKKKIKEDKVDEQQEQQEVIVDDPEPENEVTLPDPTKKKPKKSSKVQESVLINESTRYEYLNKLKQIDKKGIRDYMSRAGTRSEKIQNVILEQAENTCKDPDDNFELLKSVVKVMKKIKSPGDKK